MKSYLRIFCASLMFALFSTPASAIIIQNANLQWDEDDRLLALSGDITSAPNPITDIWFDWDGPLNDFDFTTSSLLSSNIGGNFQAPYFTVPNGLFAVTGINGAPQSTPLNFNFLFSIGGTTNLFEFETVDVGINNASLDFFGEFVNDALRPTVADLSTPTPTSVPEPGMFSLLGIGGILGLAIARRNRRAVIKQSAQ